LLQCGSVCAVSKNCCAGGLFMWQLNCCNTVLHCIFCARGVPELATALQAALPVLCMPCCVHGGLIAWLQCLNTFFLLCIQPRLSSAAWWCLA
jgi:hypothetical protein